MTTLTRPSPKRAIGGAFLAIFGALWLVNACFQANFARAPWLVAIALGCVALLAWTRKVYLTRGVGYVELADPAEQLRIKRAFKLVNVAQYGGIALVLVVMNVIHHPEWIAAGIVAVVGAHFLPLARTFRYRGYYLTAAAMLGVALLNVLVGDAQITRALTFLATGAILWVTAFCLLTDS